MSNDIITREELIRTLNESGRSVTERMVRYWEQLGIIDKSTRIGLCVYFPRSIIPYAKLVYDIKNDSIAIVRKHGRELIKILGEIDNEE
jgi:hypothetical protein